MGFAADDAGSALTKKYQQMFIANSARRWCGRRGHWQRDCWQKQNMKGASKGSGDRGREQQRPHVNQIATTTQRDLKQPEAEEEVGMIEEGWVLMLSTQGQPWGYIWLDSACFDHVCPPWFGDAPIQPCESERVAVLMDINFSCTAHEHLS